MSASDRDLAHMFYIQARDDEESSFCLFDAKHYGNSAYLCQQSIEKTIKAAMVEYGLVSQHVKRLGHTPLVKLWDMAYQDVERMVSSASDEKTKIQYEKLKELVKAGRQISRGPAGSAKIAWWKLSLTIPLTSYDIINIKKSIGDAGTAIVQIVELFNYISKLADSKRAKNIGGKQARNKIKDVSADLTKCLNEVNQTNNISLDQFKIITANLNKLSNALSIITQQQKNKPVPYSFIVMMLWIFEYFLPIFMITPHEDIGRYPLMVGDRSSIDWYKEKHSKLLDLEKTIQKGRNDLITRMRPDIRRRSNRLQTTHIPNRVGS